MLHYRNAFVKSKLARFAHLCCRKGGAASMRPQTMGEHASSKKVRKISSVGTLHAHSIDMRSRRERATLLWEALEFKVARPFLSAKAHEARMP